MGSYSGEEYVPPQPARALSFATPQAERPYQSSKKTHSTNISGDKCNPAVAKSSRPKKKFKQGEDDDDVSIQDGTDDKDMDFVPITDKAMENIIGKGTLGRDDIDKRMRMRHREAFMATAFPEGPGNQSHPNAQVRSGSMKTCRPKSEVNYIIYVITNWEKGTEVNKMAPGLDKDRLINLVDSIAQGTSTSISISLRRFGLLEMQNHAQSLGSTTRMVHMGTLCQGRSSLMQLMTCIPTMHTKVRRGLGSIAETSMPTSPRTMSSSFAPLASHA